MIDVAKRIAKISIECKIDIQEKAYLDNFRPELMEVVYQWARGEKFIDVCKLTDAFEGSIIRAMRRLDELIHEMISAAKSIGNTPLEEKFAEGIEHFDLIIASKCIRRDIVFAASLYL